MKYGILQTRSQGKAILSDRSVQPIVTMKLLLWADNDIPKRQPDNYTEIFLDDQEFLFVIQCVKDSFAA